MTKSRDPRSDAALNSRFSRPVSCAAKKMRHVAIRPWSAAQRECRNRGPRLGVDRRAARSARRSPACRAPTTCTPPTLIPRGRQRAVGHAVAVVPRPAPVGRSSHTSMPATGRDEAPAAARPAGDRAGPARPGAGRRGADDPAFAGRRRCRRRIGRERRHRRRAAAQSMRVSASLWNSSFCACPGWSSGKAKRALVRSCSVSLSGEAARRRAATAPTCRAARRRWSKRRGAAGAVAPPSPPRHSRRPARRSRPCAARPTAGVIVSR